MKKLTLIYYLAIMMLLVGQAVYTVYQLTQLTSYGRQVAELQQTQQQLLTQQSQLEQQLAQQLSLTHQTNSEAVKGYQPITNLVSINTAQELASR
ncbi:MAG: hypothetical protein GF390_03475 [Candidatus Pacebacteria bacterium]|nr:hypothetical protein [Candidatus Paceibacterota bacterium]